MQEAASLMVRRSTRELYEYIYIYIYIYIIHNNEIYIYIYTHILMHLPP